MSLQAMVSSTVPSFSSAVFLNLIFSSIARVGNYLNPNRQDFAGLFVFKIQAMLFFPGKQRAFILDDSNKG